MIVLDGTNGITSPNETITGSLNTPNTFGFKNRIINGGMVIDQRNAGASVTVTNAVGYSLDRYRVVALGTSLGFSSVRSSTAPTGFTNSYLATVTTAKSVASTDQTRIDQFIEGFNIADLGWGTASAATVTLSFWVRSSVTGTYCVGIGNSSSPTRTYISEYTISSANTFEYKTIVISGDTTGTWTTGNSVGVGVSFILGMGSSFNGSTGWQAGEKYQTTNQTQWIATSGATFYITGVQLEKGSVATSFDQRAYSQELAMCQRYFYWNGGSNDASFFNVNSDNIAGAYTFKVPMRTTPTITSYNGTTSGAVDKIGVGQTASTLILKTSNMGFGLMNTTGIGGGVGGAVFNVMASAEL